MPERQPQNYNSEAAPKRGGVLQQPESRLTRPETAVNPFNQPPTEPIIPSVGATPETPPVDPLHAGFDAIDRGVEPHKGPELGTGGVLFEQGSSVQPDFDRAPIVEVQEASNWDNKDPRLLKERYARWLRKEFSWMDEESIQQMLEEDLTNKLFVKVIGALEQVDEELRRTDPDRKRWFEGVPDEESG